MTGWLEDIFNYPANKLKKEIKLLPQVLYLQMIIVYLLFILSY